MGAWERISVEVPSDVAEAARQAVARDGYESLNQLVNLALDEWFSVQQSEERKLQSLRAAIRDGVESGPGIPAEEVHAELEALIASYEPRNKAA